MVALFGCVWAIVTTAACVVAVVTRRSVLAWMKARRWRKSGDDTVEIVRPGLRKVAVYAALVVLALPAGVMAGGSALPGPSAQGSVGVPTIGGTMTGQLVFSGVTTDITTGTNENLSLAPNGTGQVDIQAPIQNSQGTTLDFREALTNGGTSTCNGVAGTDGEFCIIPTTGEGFMVSTETGNVYQRIWAKAGVGSAFMQFVPSGTGARGALDFYTSGASSLAASFVYYGSTYTNANVADKTGIHAVSKKIMFARDDNVAAGTDAVEFTDNVSATMAVLFAVDGNGAVRFQDKTSAHGATCNSANEGLLYYRSISASNKSGFCVCAETSSGVYGWKMGMTFGSSALTDGDC